MRTEISFQHPKVIKEFSFAIYINVMKIVVPPLISKYSKNKVLKALGHNAIALIKWLAQLKKYKKKPMPLNLKIIILKRAKRPTNQGGTFRSIVNFIKINS